LTQHNKSLGNWGETVAKNELEKIGYTILEMNFHCRFGEIDIIAEDANEIVFIEVKTRNNNKRGDAIEAISKTKQKHLMFAAQMYLKQKGMEERQYRIDIATLQKKKNGNWKFQLIKAAVTMF
jgi:putative endonuclease